MAYVYKVKKGDTLNSIAQRYGFSNYKQAGISSVPSGDFNLIREGEQVTLGNYDPNKVQGISTGSSVISSTDNAQAFKNNSNELDRLLGSQNQPQDTNNVDNTNNKNTDTTTTTKDKLSVDENGQLLTGDPVQAKLAEAEAKRRAQAEKDAERQKKEYEKLFKTQLASIDATANATTLRINDTYSKRLEEQARINDLNIARVKAYGLGGGGRFTPVSFGDAITNREREASDKITSLERERDNLIAQAEQARREGESALLESKLNNIFDVEAQLRSNLQQIEKDAEAQYKLLREYREEEEAKHQEDVKKMQEKLAVIATQYGEDIDNMTPEEKDAFITELANKTGLDYATVFTSIQSGRQQGILDSLEIEKKKADIDASKALKNQRDASTYKTYKDANKSDSGSDYSETEQRKLRQAGLENADQQTKDDYLYGDDIQREEAKNKASSGTMTAPDGTVIDVSGLTEDEKDELRSAGYN